MVSARWGGRHNSRRTHPGSDRDMEATAASRDNPIKFFTIAERERRGASGMSLL